MDEPIYRQPTPFRPVAQPGGGQIAVLSQPVGNGASLAAALMRGTGGGARSIGHGIGQAASKIAAAGIAKREKEETAKRNEALARLLTDPNATPEQVAAGFAAAGDYSIAKDAYNRRVNPPKRETVKDATGRLRYLDDGSYVFSDVEAPTEKPVTVSPGAALINPKTGEVIYQSNKSDAKLTTLKSPDGKSERTLRITDENLDKLTSAGWTEVKAPTTKIDIGNDNFPTPPSGYDYLRNEDGSPKIVDGQPTLAPIRGGPASDKAKAAEEQATVKGEQKAASTGIISQDIGRIKKLVKDNPAFTTGWGALISPIPGTAAHNVSKLLDTVKSNIGFDKLQSMRDASPTGGALGQVSEFENRLLQAVFGSLEQSQSMEQLLFNLDRLDFVTNAFVNGVKDGDTYRPIQPGDMEAFAAKYNEENGLATPDQQDAAPLPRAVNPTTGETLELRDGQWVPVE